MITKKSVAVWLRALIFSALNRSSSHRCGFEPSSGHERQAEFCLRVVRWFLSGISHFRPTLRLTQLMGEIILTGRKKTTKKSMILSNIVNLECFTMKIRTPQKCAVIALKFEQGGFTVE